MLVGHAVLSMAEATQPLFEPSIITWSKSEKPKMPIPTKLTIRNNVARYFINIPLVYTPHTLLVKSKKWITSNPRPTKKPARIHSPDPFLRAEIRISVLPNPNPQKIVRQNRVHRIGTRIPSVSPLEKPDLARHHHTK